MEFLHSFILNPQASQEFNNRSNGTICGILELPDGDKLVYGDFEQFDGHDVGHIVMLNPDLTFNEAMTSLFGSGASGGINDVVINEKGQLIIGGSFTYFNGHEVGYIVVLDADFTFDINANSAIGEGADDRISHISLLPESRVMFHSDRGDFSTFNGHDTDDTVILDNDFAFNNDLTHTIGRRFLGGYLKKIITLPDGLLLALGSFQNVDNQDVGCIAVLNGDLSFNKAKTALFGEGASDWIREALILPDKKILICGDFHIFNSHATGNIAILNPDLSFNQDKTSEFGSGADAYIEKAAVLPDGRLIVFSNGMEEFDNQNVIDLAWFDVMRNIEINSDEDLVELSINGVQIDIPPGRTLTIKSVKKTT